jgi:hypothetical protein
MPWMKKYTKIIEKIQKQQFPSSELNLVANFRIMNYSNLLMIKGIKISLMRINEFYSGEGFVSPIAVCYDQ